MPDDLKITIDVDLGKNGGRRLYQSVEELEQWVKSENAFWDWLRQTNWDSKLNYRYLNQLRQFDIQLNAAGRSTGVQVKALGRISTAIKELRTQGGISEKTASSLKALFIEVYAPANGSAPTAIHSGSPAGKAVDVLREKDPALGIGALAFFLKQRADIVSSDDAEAICRSVLYDQGIEGVAVAEKKALEDIYTEWATTLADTKKESGEQLDTLSGLVSSEQGKAVERKSEFEKFMADSQAGLKQVVDASKTELTNIEKTYNEKLALQASVTYWTEKASKHGGLARTFTLTSIFVFLAGGFALFKTMELIIGEAKVSEVQVWKLGVLVILATVVVWAIRVVVRLLMSNLHLHDDAEERRTMLLTYLALLREGALPEGDVRQLILQALFRPAATGIIRDDAAPPFMAQWLKLTTGGD